VKRVCVLLDGDFPPDPRVEKETESLVRAGFDVTVVCKRKSREVAAADEWKGAKVERMLVKRWSKRRSVDKLLDYFFFPFMASAKFLKLHGRKKFDYILAANPPDNLLLVANAIGWIERVRVIDDFHDPFPELVAGHARNPFFFAVLEALESLCVKTASRVITVSRICADLLEKRGASNVTIVHNRPDESFKPRNNRLKRRFGKFVLFAGSLVEQNGVLDFLGALKLASAEMRKHGVKAVIAGSGPLEGRVVEFIEREKVSDFVSFIGRIDRASVADYIGASFAVAVPFKRTPITVIGTPNKLFEGLRLQKFVVAADLPGIRAAAGDAVIYFNAGDVHSLSNAILVAAGVRKGRTPSAALLRKAAAASAWSSDEKAFLKCFD